MRSLSSRLDLPLGWLAVSVLMQTELCSQISWNLIKSNEPLGSAYILENCIRRDFLHSERVSFLLASMDQRTDFSLRGFKKKTASLQVESRFCTVTIATCSPESIFFLSRLFPSGLNKQCGMESPVQCTADVNCVQYVLRESAECVFMQSCCAGLIVVSLFKLNLRMHKYYLAGLLAFLTCYFLLLAATIS